MYKHGVAFVERSGSIDGDFDLSFRREDMKDVLKSLAVAVVDGDVSVGTVAFDTPSDPRAELENRNLLFESGEALVGLLDGLRGRAVEVHCEDRRHRGEVIGVDEFVGGRQTRRLLVLRTDTGVVSLVDLRDAQSVEVLEDRSRDDLDYFVDRSRSASAGENRTATVRIRGRADDARVSYIVPSPVWRVSYRVIDDGDSVTVVAMGIVHNPLDEDLTDVALTLTTGQPISFDIDLYRGKHVQRTVVEETERVAAPPDARRKKYRAESGVGRESAAYAMSGGAFAAPDAYEESAEEVQTDDRGEHFEYRLTTPVSLKRGGAAMVPLVVKPVDNVRRERIWRDGSEAAPDIVLAFTNTTGVVLEEGPAVVYEEGSYAGEAMLPFSSRGADLRLAFAKDLAVRCRHTTTYSTVTSRVRLDREAAIEEQREELRHVLRAENDQDEPVDVIFELPLTVGHAVVPQDGVAEVSESGSWHRLRVTVPGHGVVEASVLETWPSYCEVEYELLSPGQLEEWLAERSLDEATVGALSGVLAGWEQATRMDAQREQLEAERNDIYTAQSRIAEQLKVLVSDGPESDLRRRHVRELEQLQNQVDELEGRIRRLRDDASTARESASAGLRQMIDGTTS